MRIVLDAEAGTFLQSHQLLDELLQGGPLQHRRLFDGGLEQSRFVSGFNVMLMPTIPGQFLATIAVRLADCWEPRERGGIY